MWVERGIVDQRLPKVPNNPKKQWVGHRARSKIMSFMISLKKSLVQCVDVAPGQVWCPTLPQSSLVGPGAAPELKRQCKGFADASLATFHGRLVWDDRCMKTDMKGVGLSACPHEVGAWYPVDGNHNAGLLLCRNR